MAKPYTQRVWLLGLDTEAERFVAAIPAARRAWWNRVLIAEMTDAEPLRIGWVYAVFTKDGRVCAVPLSEQALRDDPEGLAPVAEEDARSGYEWHVVHEPERPGA